MSSVAVPLQESILKNWMPWVGRLLGLFPIGIILLSANWKLTANPWYVGEIARVGWGADILPVLATIQLTGIVLYVIPRTALLGCVLLTGYLGGAIATYFRMGEYYPAMLPLTTSLIAWLGLYLRDERLRTMLPIRRQASRS